VTDVVPSAYPRFAGPLIATFEHRSLADAAGGVTLADALPVHSATTGSGQTISGSVVSTTLTLLEHELALPEASVAE